MATALIRKIFLLLWINNKEQRLQPIMNGSRATFRKIAPTRRSPAKRGCTSLIWLITFVYNSACRSRRPSAISSLPAMAWALRSASRAPSRRCSVSLRLSCVVPLQISAISRQPARRQHGAVVRQQLRTGMAQHLVIQGIQQIGQRARRVMAQPFETAFL